MATLAPCLSMVSQEVSLVTPSLLLLRLISYLGFPVLLWEAKVINKTEEFRAFPIWCPLRGMYVGPAWFIRPHLQIGIMGEEDGKNVYRVTRGKEWQKGVGEIDAGGLRHRLEFGGKREKRELGAKSSPDGWDVVGFGGVKKL